MKPKRALAILVPVLTFALGLWLGWRANGFIAQDACLDRGGAWDQEQRICDTGAATALSH